MNLKSLYHKCRSQLVILAILCTTLAACQPSEKEQQTSPEEQAPIAVADTTEPRPAPEFFVIPPQMAKNRVWIRDDGYSDTFHTKNDCKVLKGCLGTFRNVMLARAIEHFGRYNCQVCSKDLDHIYDEEMIRAEY